MHFITFPLKAMSGPAYTALNVPHILISIKDPGQQINIPKVHHCKGVLTLEFYDVEDLNLGYEGFDQSMARQILDFVNNYADKIDLIVVHCQAGVSRSVAVASALSKIINHKDDNVFSYGIPNMLTYITLLDVYFSQKDYSKKWNKIYYLRKESMSNCLDPVVERMGEYKVRKREEGAN